MAFECNPGDTIEVSELIAYIDTKVPLDGSDPMTGSFDGGGQVFKFAANAVDQTDLTTLGQVDNKISIGSYNRASRSNN